MTASKIESPASKKTFELPKNTAICSVFALFNIALDKCNM